MVYGVYEIVFLGTGGGRFVMTAQKRRTGGLRILSNKVNAHVDPGPGALVYSLEMGLDPQRIDAILVSHSHLDHSNDTSVLIEAMTHGTTQKRGILAASHSVLEGNDVCDAAISRYHRNLPGKVIEAKIGTSFAMNNVNVKASKAVYADPDSVGFRFDTQDFGEFAYMPDSEYFEDVCDFYGGVRLLILSVLRPSGKPWKGHMSTDEATKIVGEVKPEMTLITHFGMPMILTGPEREAALIEKETRVPTVAATDGMHLAFGKEIVTGKPEKQANLTGFLGSL